jgi:predicted ATPase
MLRDQRRCAEAIAVLKPVYNRFTEGFGTTDLANAKALIDDLHRVSRDDKERLASVRRTSRRII